MYVKLKELFKKNRTLLKRGMFFRRMLLLYTVCTTIVFIGFGVAMSLSLQKDHQSQISKLNERALFQSSSTCSTTLDNLYNYFYMQILESPELVNILLADHYSQELSISFWEMNRKLVNYSNLVESSYVVNLQGNFICSTMDTYQSIENFPDQDILIRLRDFEKRPGIYQLMSRKTNYEINGKQYNKEFISLVFKKYKEGYLVINLDFDKFTDMVNYNNYNASSQTLLISKEGQVIADSNGKLFGEDVSEKEIFRKMKKGETSVGQFHIVHEGSKKIIDYRQNELFGINYVTITDAAMIGNSVLMGRLSIYALLAVLINLIFIIIGTCILYLPIGKLQDKIIVGEDAGSKVDEFKLLEKAFGNMKKDSREYYLAKRKRLFRDILEDKTIRDSSMLEEVKKVSNELEGQCFLCINIYPDMEESEEKEQDHEMIKFAIDNIFREQLSSDIKVESVEYGKYLTCILNLDLAQNPFGDNGNALNINQVQRETQADGIEKALKGTRDKMQEYFSIDITCGIGIMVNDVFDLSESYQKAQEAIFFQTIKEPGAILYFEDLTHGAETEEKYPSDLVKGILDTIRSCDKGKIRNAISEFFYQLSDFHYSQAMKCILMLEMDLAKLEMKYEIYFENSEWELSEGIRNGSKLYKIQEMFLKHCLSAADAYRELKDNNPNTVQIVNSVKELVEKKIADPDLSVNAIAQEVYLSTSYLRNIFKEVTGNTLSNYIIEKRLDAVCRLMLETNWSIQKIADEMGFRSKSYLYTFFKNYKGMTPSQFRNQEKVNDENSR